MNSMFPIYPKKGNEFPLFPPYLGWEQMELSWEIPNSHRALMELPVGFSWRFSTHPFPPILMQEKLRNIHGGKRFGLNSQIFGNKLNPWWVFSGEIFGIWNSQGLSLLQIHQLILEATFGIGDEVPSQNMPGKKGIIRECGNESQFFPPGKAPATFWLFLSIFWGILAIPRDVGTSRPGWGNMGILPRFPKIPTAFRVLQTVPGEN